MIGIIYKFTIIAKYKYDDHKPFYVGQHWEKVSAKNFLSKRYSKYYGSGNIWNKYIEKLKQDYPKNWKIFIKREILYQSEKITQRGLDAMEAYYIKREKAHYSYGLGGCNVLWGTANEFGSGSPASDPMVAEKIRQKMIERMSRPEVRKYYSELFKGEKFAGKNNPFYGRHHTEETMKKILETKKENNSMVCKDETKKKISKTIRNKIEKGEWVGGMTGKHHTEETKKKISEATKGENNPMYGVSLSGEKHWNYGRHWDEAHRKHQSEVLKRKYASGEFVSPFKGRHHSEETKKKLSESRKGKCTGKDNPFYGRHHTEETREKLRQIHLRKSRVKSNKTI